MTTNTNSNAARTAALEQIAKAHDIETLETRRSDRLDFHDVSAASLKAMLEAAYEAGRMVEAGKAARAEAAEFADPKHRYTAFRKDGRKVNVSIPRD